MEWRRKGQSGAAVLIALIALLMILYILFLPPEDRLAILGETGSGDVDDIPSDSSNVLFKTVPTLGRDSGVETRFLPAFTVRTVTSGNILAERSSIHVERSVFHNEGDLLRFSTPRTARNVMLSFTVSESVGMLMIRLNGETIFSEELTGRQGPPITIPTDKLNENNELEFGASGVGFAVWKKHQYTIDNVKVTGDVTRFDEASQTQRFVITELDDVERVQLRFRPNCFEDVGKLSVFVNEEVVYTGRPECGVELFQDLAIGRLNEGENTLSWSVAGGRYVIDDVQIITESETPESRESFKIGRELFSTLLAQQKSIMLRLSFREMGSEGVVVVNGEELAFRTHKQSFAGPITPFVSPGSNTVTIKESSSDILLLEVLHE